MTKSNRIVDMEGSTMLRAAKAIRDERNQLRIALGTFGRHSEGCPAIATGKCNCGWSDVAKRWGIKRS